MRTPSLQMYRRPACTWSPCILLLVSLVAATPGVHASLPRHRQPKLLVQTVQHLENKWLAAQMAGNSTVMANMLADDYLGISPDGTLETKAETLAAYKNGTLHFTTMEPSDRKIRIYGSTAVVVSKVEVAGTRNGEDLSGRYRYTRVYHYDGTTWKIVSFEASPIRESAHKP